MPEEILNKLHHALHLFQLGAQEGSAAYYQYLVSVGNDVKHVFTDKRLFVIVDRPDLKGPRLSVDAVPTEASPALNASGAFLSTQNGAMLFDPQLAAFLTRPAAEGPITRTNNQIIFPATAWNSIKPRYIILRKDSLYLVGDDMYATEFKHVVPDVHEVLLPVPEKPELKNLIGEAMTGAFDIRSYVNGANYNVALTMKTKDGITVICSLPRYANKQTTADIHIATENGPVDLTEIIGGKFTWKGSKMDKNEQPPAISAPAMPKLAPAAPKAFKNSTPTVVDPAALLERANANTQPALANVDMTGIAVDEIHGDAPVVIGCDHGVSGSGRSVGAPAVPVEPVKTPVIPHPSGNTTATPSAAPPATSPANLPPQPKPVDVVKEAIAVTAELTQPSPTTVPTLPPEGEPPAPRELTTAEQFQELADAMQVLVDAVPVLVKRMKAFSKTYKTAQKQQDAAKNAETNKIIADLRAENASLRKNWDRVKAALEV